MTTPVPEDMSQRLADRDRLTALTIVSWLARLVLAGVFLVAAVPKLLDPAAFAAAIGNFRVCPESMVNAIATVVPALELCGALALLTPWCRGGALLLGALLIAFTALLASSLARGLDLDCGCFGTTAQAEPVTPLDLLRNAGLLALVVLVLVPRRVR